MSDPLVWGGPTFDGGFAGDVRLVADISIRLSLVNWPKGRIG